MVHLHPTSVTGTAALAAWLRPSDEPPGRLTEDLLDRAHAHGVDVLIADACLRSHNGGALTAHLKDLVAANEALAALRARELRRVLDGLAAAAVRPLVIKGAHLAHVAYSSPGLRVRSDTDLVIGADECDRAARVLHALGYVRAVHVRGTLILGQHHFHYVDGVGVAHALDVHWRIAAPLVLRPVLPVETLRAAAVPIPSLGDKAFGPAPPHALIIACVHLAAHHRDDPLLLWLYEIAALAAALSDRQADEFVAYVVDQRVARVVAHALSRARDEFDNRPLADLEQRLRRVEPGRELSERLLSANRPIDGLWLDLGAAGGWRERARLLQEHLWPDAAYMRARGEAGWLPLSYARRAVVGAWRWMAPSATRTAERASRSADCAAAPPSRAISRTTR
jgi:hypothetical protein